MKMDVFYRMTMNPAFCLCDKSIYCFCIIFHLIGKRHGVNKLRYLGNACVMMVMPLGSGRSPIMPMRAMLL